MKILKIKKLKNRSKIIPAFLPFFFGISLFLPFSKSLYAADSFKGEEERQLYQQGITHRNDSKWQEAVDCFKPLAEKKYVRAQHNLAFCLFELGKELEAYNWYQKASDQGFVQSKNNIGRMNLLCLLLPNETLTHVVSFFTMKDIYHCNTLCHRTHEAVRSAVTRTNFLISKSPYATQFFSLFKDVQFDPMPKELRLSQLAKAKKGSIEVHFRDTKHLRGIVEELQLIESDDRLYFISDHTTRQFSRS